MNLTSNNQMEQDRLEIADSGNDSPGGSLKLPDPWLFDSEALIREIDRIREAALQVPTNGDANATHFGLQAVVNAAWTLRENLRYLLQLHRQAQRQFRKAEPQHQTIYALFSWLLTSCEQLHFQIAADNSAR